ncbi:hypothetical protein C7T94_10520 [Pedobacter yulinensis]|uniref:PhnB-like domain-containing protein n=2 Tax=Pedobacter yulinensis TaxID=2126353 RepID=A0A2T3HKV9_9SPHI|nr:hypothetical protein C7T94_10520 [Pedobacter yulinensis]
MSKFTTFLWSDRDPEAVANYYVNIFKDSKITSSMMGPDGKALVVAFELNGSAFAALGGGPARHFTEAVSFMVPCADQSEIDYYWNALIADGGEPSMCGWLKDKFGVSWQITPPRLVELMSDPDRKKADAVMQAMMQMRKLDLAVIEQAYAGT